VENSASRADNRAVIDRHAGRNEDVAGDPTLRANDNGRRNDGVAGAFHVVAASAEIAVLGNDAVGADANLGQGIKHNRLSQA
jgi:hypothetical protein